MPQARWSWTGVIDPGGTTRLKSDSERSAARKRSHWPMPPPIPLSGAASWNSPGSHDSSASSSEKSGARESAASSGEAARAITSRTSATTPRTRGVSSTYSSSVSGGSSESEPHIGEVPEARGNPQRRQRDEDGAADEGQRVARVVLVVDEPELDRDDSVDERPEDRMHEHTVVRGL